MMNTTPEGTPNRDAPISSAADVPWVTSEESVRVPDTSMRPDSASASDPWQPAARRAADAARHDAGSVSEWADTARAMVRSSPLAALFAALVVGAVVSRVRR